jgi:hypothetical protein
MQAQIGSVLRLALLLGFVLVSPAGPGRAQTRLPAAGEIRVGAAAAELQADDSMIIAGGITAGKASGQEGKLRCVATVLEKDGTRLAIVACDVLMMKSAQPRRSQARRLSGLDGLPQLRRARHRRTHRRRSRGHAQGTGQVIAVVPWMAAGLHRTKNGFARLAPEGQTLIHATDPGPS